MATQTRREQNRADIARMIEAGIKPPRFPMPRCECGELARFEVNQYPKIDFYCAKRLPTDALEPQWRGR